VLQHRFETVAQGKGEALGKSLAPLPAGADGVDHLDLVCEIHEALGVRRNGHAEPDGGDPFSPRHGRASTGVPTSRPPASITSFRLCMAATAGRCATLITVAAPSRARRRAYICASAASSSADVASSRNNQFG